MIPRCVVWGLGFVFAVTAYAQDAAQLLTAQLSQNKTVQAHFVQTVYDEDQRVIQRASGMMRLSKPRRFYWQVDAPSNQVIVADGQSIWIYDKDLEQVVKRKQKDMDTLPAQLLSGSLEALTKDYRVTLEQKPTRSIYTLDTEKKDGPFSALTLDFVGNTIVQMSIIDALGQRSVFVFDHVIANKPIASSWYQFQPPKGVDVIIE
jgi:outer membrane lipoprotein carrier protein